MYTYPIDGKYSVNWIGILTEEEENKEEEYISYNINMGMEMIGSNLMKYLEIWHLFTYDVEFRLGNEGSNLLPTRVK